MEFRVFIEPQQGARYADQLAVAQTAEQLGYAAFFRSDHYLAMSGDGQPGPTDSWVTLGAIARETSSIRLGTLVTSATFRYPGPLAISVAQVDEMSGGRVELGLGSGWFAPEHEAYGIPFPSVRERFERLSEQLAIVTGLWTTKPGETFDYAGKHYTLAGSPGASQTGAKPASTDRHRRHRRQAHPGTGRHVRRRIQHPVRAARRRQRPSASGWPRRSPRPADRPTPSCTRPRSWSARAAMTPKWPAARRRSAETWTNYVPTARWSARPPRSSTTSVRWADIGVRRVYTQLLDLSDLAHLELFADEVMPQLR